MTSPEATPASIVSPDAVLVLQDHEDAGEEVRDQVAGAETDRHTRDPRGGQQRGQVDLEGAEDHQGRGAEDQERRHRAEHGADGLRALAAALRVDQQAAERRAAPRPGPLRFIRSMSLVMARRIDSAARSRSPRSARCGDRCSARWTSSPRPSLRRSSRSPGRRRASGAAVGAPRDRDGDGPRRRTADRDTAGTSRAACRRHGRPQSADGELVVAVTERHRKGTIHHTNGATCADRPPCSRERPCSPGGEAGVVPGRQHGVWSKTLPARYPDVVALGPGMRRD